jgi:hypothetical protein
MTTGSLVRHTPTGGLGLIVKHSMYDEDWGGFRVLFNKPVSVVVDGENTKKIVWIFDRADKFYPVS